VADEGYILSITEAIKTACIFQKNECLNAVYSSRWTTE